MSLLNEDELCLSPAQDSPVHREDRECSLIKNNIPSPLDHGNLLSAEQYKHFRQPSDCQNHQDLF